MSKNNRTYEGDDGKTIVDMNVDGMPWYDPHVKEKKDAGGERVQLNSEEGKAAIWGTLKASLLITAVFAGAYFLFILFCDFVWFK